MASRRLDPRSYKLLVQSIFCVEALTHGHLLLGSSLQALPEPETPDNTKIMTSRYKHLKLTLQHIWKRWSQEYLIGLQQIQKWM